MISANKYHLFVISFSVYIFVNLFENIIHYNIGRFSQPESCKNLPLTCNNFQFPSKLDFIKIVGVMGASALLQAALTESFYTF